MTIPSFTRRAAILAASAFTLVACGNADDGATANPISGNSGDANEMSLGAADAPVVLVEYASITCPHCKSFHEDVMPTIKADYIAKGQLRYVFYDFPTPPVNIAVAGAAIGRCAGDDKFFDVLDDLFENQAGIMSAARAGAAKGALEAVAARHGLDSAAFDSCLENTDVRRAIADGVQKGEAQGVRSTPSLFLNGIELTTAASRTADGLSAIIDEALGIEPAPETDDNTDTSVESSDTSEDE